MSHRRPANVHSHASYVARRDGAAARTAGRGERAKVTGSEAILGPYHQNGRSIRYGWGKDRDSELTDNAGLDVSSTEICEITPFGKNSD